MKYCTKCVNPDTRPGLTFDEEGVCGVCRYWDTRHKIDWKAKRKELDEIISWAKKRSTGYDCVLGVSGGKDSHRLAFFIKEKLGLNALLACCVPDEQTEIGRHNLNNLRKHGFDLVMFRPNPIVERKLAKKSFYKYGNLGNPSEYALYSFPITTAIRYKVPLAFFGGNAALILGDHSKVIGGNDADASKVSLKNTLAGGNALDWIGDGVTEKDVLPYQIPNPEDIKKAGIKVLFLLHYIADNSEYNNAQFAIARGLKIRTDSSENLGRYRKYSALDGDFVIVNQMLKHIKLGMGYATDEACWDIREGRLTKEEAIELVKKYDGKCGEHYIQKFCDYIGITKDEFWRVANSFRGNMWEKNSKGQWVLKTSLE
jgi:N-acetyl sugar amidotransferase